jgi:isoleucyl-tRNA synthetase
VAVEQYPHNYPHCWRCKTELLFRLVDEWYIRMDWREEIMRVCYDITWIPESGCSGSWTGYAIWATG